jgi:hypothetical protein
MKFTGQVKKIKGDPVRLMGGRRRLHDPRIERNLPHQREFRRVGEPFQRRSIDDCRIGKIRGQVGKDSAGIAEDGLPAGVSILDVEDGIASELALLGVGAPNEMR